MSDAARPGPNTLRAADDADAIAARVRSLRSGCSCHVHRDEITGREMSAWTDPSCPLHGAAISAANAGLSALAPAAPAPRAEPSLFDRCGLVCEIIRVRHRLYVATDCSEIAAQARRLPAIELALAETRRQQGVGR
jgi:hypothetical protein